MQPNGTRPQTKFAVLWKEGRDKRMDASLTFFNRLRDSGGGPYVHVQTVQTVPSTNIQATARYLDD